MEKYGPWLEPDTRGCSKHKVKRHFSNDDLTGLKSELRRMCVGAENPVEETNSQGRAQRMTNFMIRVTQAEEQHRRGRGFRKLIQHKMKFYKPNDLVSAEDLDLLKPEYSPVQRLLDETDYQLSPYIKQNGGIQYFDQDGSPTRSTSLSFNNSPSLRLLPMSKSAQY